MQPCPSSAGDKFLILGAKGHVNDQESEAAKSLGHMFEGWEDDNELSQKRAMVLGSLAVLREDSSNMDEVALSRLEGLEFMLGVNTFRYEDMPPEDADLISNLLAADTRYLKSVKTSYDSESKQLEVQCEMRHDVNELAEDLVNSLVNGVRRSLSRS